MIRTPHTCSVTCHATRRHTTTTPHHTTHHTTPHGATTYHAAPHRTRVAVSIQLKAKLVSHCGISSGESARGKTHQRRGLSRSRKRSAHHLAVSSGAPCTAAPCHNRPPCMHKRFFFEVSTYSSRARLGKMILTWKASEPKTVFSYTSVRPSLSTVCVKGASSFVPLIDSGSRYCALWLPGTRIRPPP